ncbi:MAG: O-antigen ligase family protein [Planctomycetota bacterium]|nr:O-antigen ligase family protein [Planctomycetota bacterium]
MSTQRIRRRKHSEGSTGQGEHVISDGVPPLAAGLSIKLVDLGFIGLICVMPFIMGGRQALGELALVGLAGYLGVAWCLAQFLQPQPDFIRSWAYWILAFAFGLVALQLVTLPPTIVHQISPRLSKALPLWSPGSESPIHLGPWSQISLTPHETLQGLIVLVAYSLIFVVAMQRIRRLEDVQMFFRWMAVAAVAMAGFGLIQFAFGNGKFFWFYESPYTDALGAVKGSFTNRNHLAHFLALGIGPLICWGVGMFQRSGSNTSSRGGFASGSSAQPNYGGLLIVLCGLGLILLACVLSLSRGGMIAMLVAFALMLAVMIRSKLLGGPALIGMGVLALGLSVGIVVCGEEMVQSRVDTVVSGDLDELDKKNRRQDIWEAVVLAIKDFPVLGTGIGSHRDVYPAYMEKVHPVEFSHAENGYLQVTMEGGIAGLILMLSGWAVCLWAAFTGLQRSSSQHTTLALAAVLAGLCVSLVHSLADFVWYVPACMVPVILLAACGFRLQSMIRPQLPSAMARTPSLGIPRIFWGAACPGGALLAVWMILQQLPSVAAEPHWHEYLKLTLNDESETPSSELDDEASADDANDNEFDSLKKKLHALTAAVKADPQNSRIRLRTAFAYMTVFQIMQNNSENAMSLSQIADAARSSPFESPEQMREWVNKVVGKSQKYLDGAMLHAREALTLSPMQGHGYMYLSELCFLDGEDQETQSAYLNQALAVRPYDPQILFAVGRDALARGDLELAARNWKGSFHRSAVYKQRIIDLLADFVPASFFTENFEPDAQSLQLLIKRYENSTRQEDLHVLLRAFAEAAHTESQVTEGDKAVQLLILAHRAYDQLQETEEAWQSLNDALSIDENSYEVHYAAGLWLYRQERFSEAVKHLDWCNEHRPGNNKLRLLCERARTRSSGRTAVRSVSHSSDDDDKLF